MSNNLVENWARYVNLKNPEYVKRYCVDRVYDIPSDKHFTTNHPNKQWNACFDICMRRGKEDEEEKVDEAVSFDNDILQEVEVIKVSFDIISRFAKVLGNIKIIVNSSSVIDLIMEECEIDFKIRHRVITILSELEDRSWNEVRKELGTDYKISQKSIEKLGKFININGELEQVRKEIKMM